MNRSFYDAQISYFINESSDQIIGKLVNTSPFADELNQKAAWKEEITILKRTLTNFTGKIYFEYSIPRMGKRIDVVLIIKSIIFIIEFKVGEEDFPQFAIDQVWDYALDLKYFHETSHDKSIVPILLCTKSKITNTIIEIISEDGVYQPIRSSIHTFLSIIQTILLQDDKDTINVGHWDTGRYCPTPNIIEAALALYKGHSVRDISRNDASAKNLGRTTKAISEIIFQSKSAKQKSICFITGVPGAGKTLVGLNIATKNINKESDVYSVYLSGNGPLVDILREALARDKVQQLKFKGQKLKKSDALREIKPFIQNIHHFRDDCLKDSNPPIEHIAIFDEAQRAWNHEQTEKFMIQKRQIESFSFSEPEFLISCLDRHKDWAVIICLVGGGQEINTGEAGIKEWLESINRSFPNWHLYVSSKLADKEYDIENMLTEFKHLSIHYSQDFHLAVSMRSFRSENVSLLIKHILDLELEKAQEVYQLLKSKYPITITRDINKAKEWLRKKARGNERYGIIVSSQAERLKPLAIDIRSPMDPVHWFLDNKNDVRSSFYLEAVATEFDIQGLELDWTCVTWDADFRYSKKGWECKSFVGDKWQNIKKSERQQYLKNAYRVLLTRARQGMIILVPAGSLIDPTRNPQFYDSTFEYLLNVGFDVA